MKQLRNQEIRHFLWRCVLGCGLLYILCDWISLSSWICTMMIIVFLLGSFLLFQKERYRHIEELSQYLQQIYEGSDGLDIRDYQEGELSILKSDIYKITRILTQQKQLLLKDKTFLADALSDISHQLKTPLTSLMMMSELLTQHDLPKEKQDLFIQQIAHQLQRMDWLISTLLKLSRIDAQAIHFDHQRVSLEELLQDSLEPLLIPMEIKDIHWHIQGAKSLVICVDKAWVKEALSNIIKNGVEHTSAHGNINILCEENPLHTQVMIQDDGCGMEKEDMAHIFERFYKGKSTGMESVGIGLSLAKAILSQNHATISVSSVPKQGTCFTIRFYK